jgi:hypothetical protein
MSTTSKPTTTDAAAQASIGAAARELHLPTVRTEAVRLAEIADRERQTTCVTSPKSWQPRSMTAPTDAARAASTTPSSRD